MFAVLLLTGCGPALEGRQGISGNVTLDGVPLDDGSISFETISSQSKKMQTGGTIKNGKYAFTGLNGLVPGEYSVQISSSEEVSRTEGADPMDVKVEYRERIPAEYGSASTQKVTVTDSGKQVFNFDIQSKKE